MTKIEKWITVMDSLPTTEGRCYHMVIEDIANTISENITRTFITLDGEGPDIELGKVAAKVHAVRFLTEYNQVNDIWNITLQIKMTLLDTPCGQQVEYDIENYGCYITPVGYGTLSESGEVQTDYSFHYFNIGIEPSSFPEATKIHCFDVE